MKLNPRVEIGLRLRAGRRAAGKSQADVCRTMEVATNKWNQWELGKHMPDPLALIEFSNTYNISLDWIYRGRTDGMAADLSERVWAIYNGLLAEITSAA